MPLESELYAPVKALLESQGYEVKGEVRGCDVVAVRGEEPPVIIELKKSFGLGLVLQAIDRLAMSERVYLAVGEWPKRWKNVRKLCRRLGVGFIVVADAEAAVVLDPEPYRPRIDKRRTGRLLGEHQRRVGDPNRGRSSTKVPVMTAYRQEALRCAAVLAASGPMRTAVLRTAANAPRAARILLDDVYGWFERVERGVYALTPAGRHGLQRHGRPVPPDPAVGEVGE
ncbi:MAG: hypothetical protein JOY64_16380 [Alphaproteobacteria bacterium]|nr:hypothetical protein [Alphaproteobacteria bacterium]